MTATDRHTPDKAAASSRVRRRAQIAFTAPSSSAPTPSMLSASIPTTPKPTRRGRLRPSARWTTHTCATSSFTCIGCSIRRCRGRRVRDTLARRRAIHGWRTCAAGSVLAVKLLGRLQESLIRQPAWRSIGRRRELSGNSPAKLAFDERARGVLRRFISDWIWPARAQGCPGFALHGRPWPPARGGYPLIIKHSFDSLMKPDSGVLPLVLTAVVVVTALRGLFLYLHQVTTMRIVLRMVTDIQKAAFAHLVSADYARITRETTGPAGVAADQRPFLHPAGRADLARRVHQGRAVGRRGVLGDALSGLADDAGHSRLVPDRDPAECATSAAGCGRYRGERRWSWAASRPGSRRSSPVRA